MKSIEDRIKALAWLFDPQNFGDEGVLFEAQSGGLKLSVVKQRKRIQIIINQLNSNKMKLAVICANGRVGQLVVKEAQSRGIEVTAVVRGENKSAANAVINKDVHDITKTDLAGFDVVVDAFGAWTPETLAQHSSSLKTICDALSGTQTRLLVVGGAGSLFVNPEHTLTVSETPDFPEIFKPLASAMAQALGELRQRNDVRWTYISPAGDFQADGARTGKYIAAGEELTLNSRGESVISYADYAIAMVDEAEDLSGKNVQKRISVVAE